MRCDGLFSAVHDHMSTGQRITKFSSKVYIVQWCLSINLNTSKQNTELDRIYKNFQVSELIWIYLSQKLDVFESFMQR